MTKEGKDCLAVLILQALLCTSRVLQPAVGAQYGESGLSRNICLLSRMLLCLLFFSA